MGTETDDEISQRDFFRPSCIDSIYLGIFDEK